MKPKDDSYFFPSRRSSYARSPQDVRRFEASKEFHASREVDASKKVDDVRSSNDRSDSNVDDAWNKIASDLERIDKFGAEYDDFESWNAYDDKTAGNSFKESEKESFSSSVDDNSYPNASARESLRRASNVLPNEVQPFSNDDKLSEDYETRNNRRNRSVWGAGEWTRSHSNEKAPERSSFDGRRSNYSRNAEFNDVKRRRDDSAFSSRRSDFSSERGEFASRNDRRDGIGTFRHPNDRSTSRRNVDERDANFRENNARKRYSNYRSDVEGYERPSDQGSRKRASFFSSDRNDVRSCQTNGRRSEYEPTIGAYGRYGEPLSLAETYAERYGGRRYEPVDLNLINEAFKDSVSEQIDVSRESTSDELAALQKKSIYELIEEARRLGDSPQGAVVRRALRERVIQAGFMLGSGTLEILPDGFGFLRSVETNYLSCADDIYVSPSQIRRFGLRSGLVVSGLIRPPKERERYFALLRIDLINGRAPTSLVSTPFFDDLVAAFPTERVKFERRAESVESTSQENPETFVSADSSVELQDVSANSVETTTFNEAIEASQGRDMRLLDLFLPIGFGQRALIVCPPRSGKTPLIRKMIGSILENYEDVFVYVVLVKKRPEDVTETRRVLVNKRCEIVGSTFDESDERHIQIVQTVFEKAKRAVEQGQNVVVFVDSTTRLISAWYGEEYGEHNMTTALQNARKIFGSSRKIDGGGSLTVVATTLWNKDGADAQVELEALQSVSHATLWLDSELAEKNIWPPINVVKSVARNCNDFVSKDERLLLEKIREKTQNQNATDAIQELLDKIAQTSNNLELLRLLDAENSAKNDDAR